MKSRLTRSAADFDRWLFGPAPDGALWVLRTGLALIFAVRLAVGTHADLGGQPPALFDPPPLWSVLDQMPSASVITFLQGIGVMLAVLAVFGRWPRATFAGAFAIFVFLDGLMGSRGKVHHNEVIPILVAVPVLLAPARLHWRDRRPRAGSGWPWRTALLVLCLGYFFAGAAKLIASGPVWVFSENLRWVLLGGSVSSQSHAPGLAGWMADQPFLPQALALGTLVIELGMIAMPFRPRLRPFAFVGIVLLHGTIWLTLGLDYFSWVATAALLLLPWSTLLTRLDRSDQSSGPERPTPAARTG